VIGNEKLLMYHSLATKMFAYQILKKISIYQWGRITQNRFGKEWMQLIKRGLVMGWIQVD
jgi:hypothetical protein